MGIVRGDTKIISITSLKYSNGDIYTLNSTDKIYMDIKKSPSSKSLIHKEITSSDYQDDALIFALTPSETKALESGVYVYDMRLVMDSNNIFTIKKESKILVVDSITDIPEGVDV